jgi:hypothetical protein
MFEVVIFGPRSSLSAEADTPDQFGAPGPAAFGVVKVSDGRHGAVRYVSPAAAGPLMGRVNRLRSERLRYAAVMSMSQNRRFRVVVVRE